MTKKTLKDFLEVYKPKSPDEQKFVDKHVTIKHKDRNGNGDDVFNAANIKTIKRKEERHGYDVGEDEKVYEEVEQVEERWSENSKKTSKNLAAAALDVGNAATGGLLSKSKLARKAMKWADSPDETTSKSRLKAYQARQARNTNEEVEDVEEARIYPGDYHVTSEKSQFGGHRPKIVHKEKGHTMYLGQHAYKKPEMARKHAEAYLSAYAQRGDTAANNATMDFARANKKHLYVKEEVEIIEGLMHDRYERSHGKKARGTGSWAFTTQRYGSPKQSEMHFTSGQKSLSDAHKEAAAKLGTKHLYVMEDIDIDTVLDEALNMLMSIDEKTLTPAEMKKREEVVKAIKRENPKMDKSMAYAVATKTAKRVAEGVVPTADEPSEHDKKMAQKVRDLLAKEKKPVKEEAEDLDESVAKVAQHLIKRYGDNVRKSHVRSAANDFGVGFVALSHHVRKKLGVNRLEEEQIDEISAAKLTDYTAKASDARGHRDMPTAKLDKRYKSMALAHEKIRQRHAKVPANEEVEVEEAVGDITVKTKSPADAFAQHTNQAKKKVSVPKDPKTGKTLYQKVTQEETELEEGMAMWKVQFPKQHAGKAIDAGTAHVKAQNVSHAHRVMAKRLGVDHKLLKAKVTKSSILPEEAEQIDELSNETLKSYLDKKKVPSGTVVANVNDKDSMRKYTNRVVGGVRAAKKLTKEEIINRTIDKYVPEEVKFTPEERLLKRLDGLSEAHVNTLLGLFEALNKDNQNKMIETVETREGINQLLNFALDNRGE